MLLLSSIIMKSSMNLARLFFKKQHLLKLIRIIVTAVQFTLFSSGSVKEQFTLTKSLVWFVQIFKRIMEKLSFL